MGCGTSSAVSQIPKTSDDQNNEISRDFEKSKSSKFNYEHENSPKNDKKSDLNNDKSNTQLRLDSHAKSEEKILIFPKDVQPNNNNQTFEPHLYQKCEEGTQILEYKFISHIGRGINSQVFKVLNVQTDEFFAAKVYSKKIFNKKFQLSDPEEQIKQEVSILQLLNHPNLIKLEEYIDDKVTNSIIMIFPLGQESLSKIIHTDRYLTEEHARVIFKPIAEGIKFLHSHNIVHRDIKPDNIMFFANNEVKLIDFSVSQLLDNDNQFLDDTEGSPAYSSPEEHSGESFDPKKADVWSFGVSLYETIFGRLPFNNNEKIGTYFEQCAKIAIHIRNDPISYEKEPPISEDLKQLFEHCLDKNPETRYSIDNVLKHPWMYQ